VSTVHEPVSPLVTVITPAYNVAQYVGETVASVLQQSFRDFEYLVADDGSQDDTIQVVMDHACNDDRVRVLQAEHRGPSSARNLGIRDARGKYIAFLDGDDRWRPRFLERQVGLIESLPANVGVVFCRSRMMLENGTLVGIQWHRSGSYDFDDFLVGNNPARNGSSLLIRKSCFEDVGVFDEDLRYAEDLDMWLRIAESGKTPVLWGSRHFLVDLRLRPGSLSRDRALSAAAFDRLLSSNCTRLRRRHAGLAYVGPATAALKYGDDDDLTAQWIARASSVGVSGLMRTKGGLRFLFWAGMPETCRRALRSVQCRTREAVKSTNRLLRGRQHRAGSGEDSRHASHPLSGRPG
jgi:glycosyltransferase involved in cell wall biosynthesis